MNKQAFPPPSQAPTHRQAEIAAVSGAMMLHRLRGHVIAPAELSRDHLALWQGFCQADPLYANPFYWPQFTLAVAASRQDARVAVLERAGTIIGFLPFHRVAPGIGKPIGGHINDYHGPVLAPGATVSGEAMLRAAGLTAYDYNHLPAAFAGLTRGAHGRAWSPQMDLANGYEDYLSRRDSRWAKAQREIRRRHRKTEAEFGPIRFAWHDPSDSTFRQLIAMKDRQYARLGIGMSMGAGWAGEVIDRLRHANGPHFAGVLSTLHAGDRLIAAHFGLRTARVLHWWLPSYDLALAKLGPGINLVHHCAIAAAGEGIETIDFGKGTEDFKLHFADRRVALAEGSITLPGSLAAQVRKGSDALVSLSSRMPLGRYRALPRKAVARLISGVGLPG